ncbi:flagellar hook-length control protein FliK [Antarctobacter sp.]|uniref:flagellar hook-length control protein FliK n=1 Tax=Antarctobacter sp. TaxID=1872577 RepID=UPI002B279BB9|nr:flagellar hook-length control protein FliK [Antarctobacter sp.]
MLSQLTSLLGLSPASRTPDAPKGDEPTVDFSSVFARAEDERPARSADHGPIAESADGEGPEEILVSDSSEDTAVPDDVDLEHPLDDRSMRDADDIMLASDSDWADDAGVIDDSDLGSLPHGSTLDDRDYERPLTAVAGSAFPDATRQTAKPEDKNDSAKRIRALNALTSPEKIVAAAQGIRDDGVQTPLADKTRVPGSQDDQPLADRKSQLHTLQTEPDGLGLVSRKDTISVAGQPTPPSRPSQAATTAFETVIVDPTNRSEARANNITNPARGLTTDHDSGRGLNFGLPKEVPPADSGLIVAKPPDVAEKTRTLETKETSDVAQRDLPVFRMDPSASEHFPQRFTRDSMSRAAPQKVMETAQGSFSSAIPNTVLDARISAPELNTPVVGSLQGPDSAAVRAQPQVAASPMAMAPEYDKAALAAPLAPSDDPKVSVHPDQTDTALTAKTSAIPGKEVLSALMAQDATYVGPRADSPFDAQALRSGIDPLTDVAMRLGSRTAAGSERLEATAPIVPASQRAPLSTPVDVRIIKEIAGPDTINKPSSIDPQPSPAMPSGSGVGPTGDKAIEPMVLNSGRVSAISALQDPRPEIKMTDPITKSEGTIPVGPMELVKVANRIDKSVVARSDKDSIRSERLATTERHATSGLPQQPVPSRLATFTATVSQVASNTPKTGIARVTAPLLADVLDEAPSAEVPVASHVGDARSFAAQPTTYMSITHRADAVATVRQVAEGMARLSDGIVEIRLSPEELGHVRMQLVSSDGGMTVHVSADRPETLDLLRRNIDQLARDLADAGYDGASFTFSEGGGGQRDGSPPTEEDGAIVGIEEQHPHRNRAAPTATDGLDLRF